MNPLRDAIFDLLAADAALTGLIGANNVWHRKAPRDATEPFVVFSKSAGRDEYTFGGRAFEPQLWLVKAVDRSRSASVAENIAARIDTLLTDANLSLSSGSVLYVKRDTHVDFGEQDGADAYQHVGGIFRITTAP